MANLQYKTRGMSNPKGKPRVYFCCHAADFDAYFEGISKELLELQNCAVWYADGAAVRDEAFLADLGEMQLFVMPVTTKLLTTENAALDMEFRLAIERHIPVLPLMQESGLDELFSQKCGDLQYLDKAKSVHDLTEIPYEEKLKKYLESILASDEMAEKIRAAFDAYVFLSYRKKDRKYAQELMRLIHKNDFCRDIAIWYDEFLTPGENFNDSIREALQKSGLFVMAVTPNLVNEENYIITTEYPMAKEEGKPILPAEVVPTDREKLAETFAGIPACADAHDDAAFGAALLENVRDLAIRENDNSPEHNFFIGLAYLGGVDVEVDHARAVELITGAAEAGLVEAVTKLVEMYRTGLGVERNYETAVKWQERKVELLEKAYQEIPGKVAFNRLFVAMYYWGNYYNELGWMREAKEVYDAMLERLNEAGTLADRRDLIVCYSKLGRICEKEEDLVEARGYYERQYAIAEQLMEETGTVEARRDLAISCNQLGDLCVAEGRVKESLDWYEQGLKLNQQNVEKTDSVKAWSCLADSCELIGSIYLREEDLQGAQEYFVRSHEIRERFVEQTGSANARRDLAGSCSNMGDLCWAEGNVAEAQAYYRREYEIIKQLVEEAGTMELQQALVSSCNNMGDVCKHERDLKKARNWYEQAYEIAERLARETDALNPQICWMICCQKMGHLCANAGDLRDAQSYYTRARELCECAGEPKTAATVRRQRAIAVNYSNLANICRRRGDSDAARVYYTQAYELYRAIAEETGTVKARRDLLISCKELAKSSESPCKGSVFYYADAVSCYEEAYELAAGLLVECGTEKNRRELIDICVWLADHGHFKYCRFEDETSTEASRARGRMYLEEAYKLTEELTANADAATKRQELSYICRKLERACKIQGDLLAAQMYYEKAYELADRQLEEEGAKLSGRERHEFYVECGEKWRVQGDLAGARRCYEKYYRELETILAAKEKKSTKEEMACVCEKLGDIYWAAKDVAGAKKCYEQGMELLMSDATINVKVYHASLCEKLERIRRRERDERYRQWEVEDYLRSMATYEQALEEQRKAKRRLKVVPLLVAAAVLLLVMVFLAEQTVWRLTAGVGVGLALAAAVAVRRDQLPVARGKIIPAKPKKPDHMEE